MALINHRTHEIHFKIVYYGPGLCGKTTNLKVLHDRLPPERRGRMISIATDHERTLFFDFLPIDLGTVNGFLTRFHLYTVPGQVYYKLSRRAVLQGVDGLVFVADSHPARENANRESLADLNEHLRTLGVTGHQLARIPWVYQWNKRDVPVAIPIERLRKALNPQNYPEFEGIASEGKGVSETLRAACKAVLARLGAGQAAPAPAAVAAAAGATSAGAAAAGAASAGAAAAPATVAAHAAAPVGVAATATAGAAPKAAPAAAAPAAPRRAPAPAAPPPGAPDAAMAASVSAAAARAAAAAAAFATGGQRPPSLPFAKPAAERPPDAIAKPRPFFAPKRPEPDRRP